MNMPAKVCLGAGAFLVMSGGLLAITGFAMGAQTHLDLDWGRAHKSETPVDTGAPHVEEAQGGYVHQAHHQATQGGGHRGYRK